MKIFTDEGPILECGTWRTEFGRIGKGRRLVEFKIYLNDDQVGNGCVLKQLTLKEKMDLINARNKKRMGK